MMMPGFRVMTPSAGSLVLELLPAVCCCLKAKAKDEHIV